MIWQQDPGLIWWLSAVPHIKGGGTSAPAKIHPYLCCRGQPLIWPVVVGDFCDCFT